MNDYNFNAKIAKRRGIKKVIVHSHTTGSSAIKGKFINNLMMKSLPAPFIFQNFMFLKD